MGKFEKKVVFKSQHDLLLDNLLISCNTLIISISKNSKMAKETNWKQIFQKPQNENICLTNLNVESIGNFHFLSFSKVAFIVVHSQ